MSWQDELAGIGARREFARAQGGEAAIAKHHARGKLTVRERIEALLDAGSFREQERMAGGAVLDERGGIESFTPANDVVGFGAIHGRRIE